MVLKAQSLITSPSGDILLTIREDHEQVCKDINTIKEATNGWTEDRGMKLSMSIPVQEYQHWADKLGSECWEDNNFLKFWKANTNGRYCL